MEEFNVIQIMLYWLVLLLQWNVLLYHSLFRPMPHSSTTCSETVVQWMLRKTLVSKHLFSSFVLDIPASPFGWEDDMNNIKLISKGWRRNTPRSMSYSIHFGGNSFIRHCSNNAVKTATNSKHFRELILLDASLEWGHFCVCNNVWIKIKIT